MHMQRLSYFILMISVLSIAVSAQSFNPLAPSSATTVNGLLLNYNVSASSISSFTYTNISYQGNSYVLVYNKSVPSFLINSTGSAYTFVLNSSQIASIIQTSIVQQSLNEINTTYLTKSMKAYNQSSAGALSSCVTELGLDRQGATCTIANFCASCSAVPVCRKVLLATGGPYGNFGAGVIQFESEYGSLQSNFSAYFSNIKSLSVSNAQSQIGKIVGDFNNVSTLTNFLNQNPVFPPPPSADYSQCVGYGASTSNVISNGGPWYCSSLGFCQFLTYNYTLLGNIQTYLNQVSALPTSPAQIGQIALSISTNENVYVLPLLSAQKLSQAKHIENTTLLGYNRTITSATLLLTHLSNKTLSTDIIRIRANYTQLSNNYVQANLTKLNKTLGSEYYNLKTAYGGLNSTYNVALGLASNNTVLLIELQTGNNAPSPASTALSFRQAEMNQQLAGNISNIAQTDSQLKTINTQSKSISNNPSFVQQSSRVIDAPVVGAILSSINAPYSTALSYAPILSIIPALIVGVIILVVLVMFRSSLTKNRRIAYNQRTARNWQLLFGFVIVLVLLFVLASYVTASGASTKAPISSFISAVHASKTVIIALNGTNSTSMISCATKVKNAITALNKTPQIITMSGIACNNGQPLETVDKCMSYYASHNEPVVIFTNSSADSISAYSYYGSVLSVNGDTSFMNTCIASTMIR